MSARPRDVYESASKFSLRDVVQLEGGHNSISATPSLPITGATAPGSLKFNLTSLAQSKPAAQTATPSPPITPASNVLPMPIPMASLNVPSKTSGISGLSLRFMGPPHLAVQPTAAPAPAPTPNLSFTSMSTPSSAKPATLGIFSRAGRAAPEVATNDSSKSDVMRLTAYVDDLTTRLQKSQSQLDQTQQQLTRASKTLCAERQAVSKQLQGYKNELAAAHDIESKLRQELSTRPARKTMEESVFTQQVAGALNEDRRQADMNTKLMELEAKVKAMADAKVMLEGEIKTITELRDNAKSELEDLRSAQISLDSTRTTIGDEVKLAQTERDQLREETATLRIEHEKLKTAQTDVQLAMTTAKDKQKDAETQMLGAKQRLDKLLLEHGDVASKVNSLNSQVKELAGQAAAMEDMKAKVKAEVDAEIARRPPPVEAILTPLPVTSEETIDCCPASPFGSEPDKEEAVEPQRVDKPVQPEEAPVVAPPTNQPIPAFVFESSADVPEAASVLDPSDVKVSTIAAELEVENLQVPNAPSPTPELRSRTAVYGAHAPDRQLCCGWDNTRAAGFARMPLGTRNVAATVSLDSPIDMAFGTSVVDFKNVSSTLDIAAANTSSEEATTGMINAVVGDLKMKLIEVSEATPAWRAVAPLA